MLIPRCFFNSFSKGFLKNQILTCTGGWEGLIVFHVYGRLGDFWITGVGLLRIIVGFRV